MISAQNIGMVGRKTRDFRAKAFLSKRIHAGGGPPMRGYAIAPRLRGPALRVFLGEKMLDILVKWGIFELNMRGCRVINGVFRVKMRVLGVKFSKGKCLLFGAKSGIFEV